MGTVSNGSDHQATRFAASRRTPASTRDASSRWPSVSPPRCRGGDRGPPARDARRGPPARGGRRPSGPAKGPSRSHRTGTPAVSRGRPPSSSSVSVLRPARSCSGPTSGLASWTLASPPAAGASRGRGRPAQGVGRGHGWPSITSCSRISYGGFTARGTVHDRQSLRIAVTPSAPPGARPGSDQAPHAVRRGATRLVELHGLGRHVESVQQEQAQREPLVEPVLHEQRPGRLELEDPARVRPVRPAAGPGSPPRRPGQRSAAGRGGRCLPFVSSSSHTLPSESGTGPPCRERLL